MISYVRRHPGSVAFLILFSANMIGFALIVNNADGDRDRARDASVSICQTAYDNRETIVKFIEGQTTTLPYPADATPETRASTDRSNERRRALREQALAAFRTPDCLETLGLRATEQGKLVPR
jgi:hypothetical protein